MRTLIYCILAGCFSVFLTPTVSISAPEMEEFRVKAAMLFNFIKYVEWPTESLANTNLLYVCFTGATPIKKDFEQYQGKSAQGKKIVVKTVTSPQETTGCNLLYFDGSEQRRISSYLQQCIKRSILTVSDTNQFASSGGIIGFYEQDEKIRFEINPDTAQQSRIIISSKLLRLARIVKGGNQ